MGHFIPGPIKPITWWLHCLHWFSLIFIFCNFFRRLLFVSLFSWAPPINPITWMLCNELVALIFTHFPSRGAGSPFYQPNHLITGSRFPHALELEISLRHRGSGVTKLISSIGNKIKRASSDCYAI